VGRYPRDKVPVLNCSIGLAGATPDSVPVSAPTDAASSALGTSTAAPSAAAKSSVLSTHLCVAALHVAAVCV
jgi:hypothetical protein